MGKRMFLGYLLDYAARSVLSKRRMMLRSLSITLGLCLTFIGANCSASDDAVAEQYVDCSAYFFMAANVRGMAEFNTYYAAGEFGYNTGVRAVGEAAALKRFNLATANINELIGRNWLEFGKADDKYGVVCADIWREANVPD